jgi:hypothetical protein
MPNTTPEAPELLSLHWVMTVDAAGRPATLSNTLQVPAGTQRGAVFNEIRLHVAQQIGRSDFAVLFFSLEPNRL